MSQPQRTVTLRAGSSATIEWNAAIRAADAPWVAVVIPDNDVSRRAEHVR